MMDRTSCQIDARYILQLQEESVSKLLTFFVGALEGFFEGESDGAFVALLVGFFDGKAVAQ